MSKRIMNEVMCFAEDLALKMCYQDTGSMHIDYDEVEILKMNLKRNLVEIWLGRIWANFISPLKWMMQKVRYTP